MWQCLRSKCISHHYSSQGAGGGSPVARITAARLPRHVGLTTSPARGYTVSGRVTTMPPSSSGQGHHPFKVKITGSNPVGGTTIQRASQRLVIAGKPV